MKKTILFLLFLPAATQAGNLNEIYWSTYACSGYIYHFDDNKNTYKKYTREYIKKTNEPRYTSYRLIEGKMKHIERAIYSLSGKDIKGITTIDFSNMNQALIKSSQLGLLALKQCDVDQSKKLIYEAEMYFKKCPNINCKSH